MTDTHTFLLRATGQYDGPGPLRGWLEAAALVAEAPRTDIAVAAALGDADAVAACLAANPESARAPGGPRDWEPLLYLCYSRVEVPGADWLRAAEALLQGGADAAATWSWGGQYPFAATTGVFGHGERGPNNQPEHPAGLPLARRLLEAGADPNDGQGLYNRMFVPGDAHLALLIEFGLGPDDPIPWTDVDGSATPGTTLQYQLMNAAEHGHIDRVERIVAAGVAASAPDPSGRHPWELAMRNGHREVAAMLVDAGAKPRPLSPIEALRSACLAADAAEVDALRQANPSLEPDPSWVDHAAGEGRVDAVRFLVDLGCPADAGALRNALWKGHVQTAELLHRCGADPTAIDPRYGSDALGHARHGGFPAAIDLATSWSQQGGGS